MLGRRGFIKTLMAAAVGSVAVKAKPANRVPPLDLVETTDLGSSARRWETIYTAGGAPNGGAHMEIYGSVAKPNSNDFEFFRVGHAENGALVWDGETMHIAPRPDGGV